MGFCYTQGSSLHVPAIQQHLHKFGIKQMFCGKSMRCLVPDVNHLVSGQNGKTSACGRDYCSLEPEQNPQLDIVASSTFSTYTLDVESCINWDISW